MDDTSNRNFRASDDVDVTFAEAVVHRPLGHTVLGFRLRPFSFWHAANLDFVESPFAGHKKAIDFAALYVAARTCQLRYPHTFRRRKLEWLIELWKMRRYRPVVIRKGGSRCPQRDGKGSTHAIGDNRIHLPLLIELNKFSTYIRDYVSRPDYVSCEDSTPVKTPWYLYEVALLRRFNPGMTWAQCWDTSTGWASWHNAAMLEATGNKIEILTPAMRKAIKEVEDLQTQIDRKSQDG